MRNGFGKVVYLGLQKDGLSEDDAALLFSRRALPDGSAARCSGALRAKIFSRRQ